MSKDSLKYRCVRLALYSRVINDEIEGYDDDNKPTYECLPLLTQCLCFDNQYEFSTDLYRTTIYHEKFPVIMGQDKTIPEITWFQILDQIAARNGDNITDGVATPDDIVNALKSIGVQA